MSKCILQIAKFSNLPGRVYFSSILRVGIGHHVWGHVRDETCRGEM